MVKNIDNNQINPTKKIESFDERLMNLIAEQVKLRKDYEDQLEQIERLTIELNETDVEIKEAEEAKEAYSENVILEEIAKQDPIITEELKNGPARERVNWKATKYIIDKFKNTKHKFLKYVVLPSSVAIAAMLTYYSPKEVYDMVLNWKERHIDKDGKDDPSIKGITEIYNDSSNVQRATYDFLGTDKIEYKSGYYITSVFDLSDRTAPRFRPINGRYDTQEIDSALGITTNLFKRFYKYSEFTPTLKGHIGAKAEKLADIPVVAYNQKTQKMLAGHYGEFNEDWIVSETYQIPLNFKLNKDSTVNLAYHNQALRMVPLTTNENEKQIPFPIGVVVDRTVKTINPEKCTHFGSLEGGKVIMVCGKKQLQVNGSFADMFKVYQRLSKENPKSSITAYLLDNGSYNLPIWNKDKKITSGEIKEHLGRNYDGGTALVLIDDGAISPYEYVNKYKEIQHYTNNFTRDAKTQKPIVNEKSVIVIHHTGNYDDPNKIIREFEGAKETSSHVLIMKDGSRHIFNNDNYVLAHAGKSDFNNRNAVNYFSIGIELEGDTKNGHQFTIAQLESLLEYIHPRIEKYGISLENITTHKIIRDNYIKKHPGENIPKKQDLDDKVWKQIHDLIAQKLYKEKITAKQ